MKKFTAAILAVAAAGLVPAAVPNASAADRVVVRDGGERMGNVTVKRRVVVRERRPDRVTVIRREREPRRVTVIDRDRDRSASRVIIRRDRDRSEGRLVIRDRDRAPDSVVIRRGNRDRDRD